jgi:ribosomal protein L32
MAVPKKKKSSSKSGMRRGSNGTFKADFTNVIVDKESGEFKLPHHVINDTYQNGELKINIRKKAKKQQKSSETNETNAKRVENNNENEVIENQSD